GYAVQDGADQSETLPWVNLRQISIRFDQDVNVAFADLQVRGVNEAVYDLDPTFGVGGVAYDDATFTATWQLDPNDVEFFDIDKVLLFLDDAVAGAANGLALNGEHAPQDSADLPSGDADPGGDFLFEFPIMPGDVNDTGSVFGNDVILVRNAQFNFAGDDGFSARRDVNGSGSIFGNDVILTRNRQFTFLPGDSPTSTATLTAVAANLAAVLATDSSLTIEADSVRDRRVDSALTVDPHFAWSQAFDAMVHSYHPLRNARALDAALGGSPLAEEVPLNGNVTDVTNAPTTRRRPPTRLAFLDLPGGEGLEEDAVDVLLAKASLVNEDEVDGIFEDWD
ncbi:MAG: hypothetical protein AAF961_02980, partial [Planctomycetota bacterium]